MAMIVVFHDSFIFPGCISAVIYVNEEYINSSIAEVTGWLDELNRDNIVIVYVVARGVRSYACILACTKPNHDLMLT